MNKIDLTAPIAFHLAHTKGVDFVYKNELARLNKILTINYAKQFTTLKSIAERCWSLAIKANNGAQLPAQGLRLLQAFQYYALKSVEYRLLADNEQIEVVLPQGGIRFGYRDSDYRAIDCADYSSYLWISLLCEQDDDLDYLVEVQDHPNVKWKTPAQYLYFEIIAGFLKLKDLDVQAKIQEFVDETTPDKISAGLNEFMTYIALPTIDVMLKIFGGADEQLYRETMYNAAQSHAEFWPQEQLAGKDDGPLSLPLTALARVAYKHRGYTLGFECDYIPEYFYQAELQAFDVSFLNASDE
ncbi:immunity 49 family protein [Shewanella sp. VB17]|uniref:Imm49 family immunity protein n=1 Tax=Shewanella sp. VB17 TaxID=2739432 RepID=UPI0015650948|nr:Imm49 family immunity protein [Shewanella sp. VB17]NRD73825.1 immunity 49 family protein [Shewanella sp. VB17]